MIIKEGLVVLRDMTIEDIPRKVKWINDPKNNDYLHYDIPINVEKTTWWFKNKDNSTRYDCVIEYDGVPVGLIGLIAVDEINNKAEYYISMGEDSYKRKGIASIATNMILMYAFSEIGLHKVYLTVDEDNVAACNLYEKMGFVCEGLLCDDLFFKGRYINRKRYAIFNTKSEELRGALKQ